MKTQLLLPMLGSVRRVFRKLFDSDTAVGSPAVLRAWADQSSRANVFIPVDGSQRGGFVLSIAQSTGDAVTAELHASSGKQDAARAERDALLELARMVVGIARRDQRISGLELLAPVISSKDTENAVFSSMRPWIVIPIITRFGDIRLAASLSAQTAVASKANETAA